MTARGGAQERGAVTGAASAARRAAVPIAAIFAGGRATRMGAAGVVKGLLVVDGRRIVDLQLAVLRPRFAEVVIAANDPTPWAGLGLRVIADRAGGGVDGQGGDTSGIGPLAGLDAVLAALPDGVDDAVCVAGDMPFLAGGVVDLLRDRAYGAAGGGALVARVAGRPQPLLARYARGAATVVRDQIARGAYALQDLLARLDVTWLEESELRAVDPALRSIINVNTPEDLARLGAGGGGPGGGAPR